MAFSLQHNYMPFDSGWRISKFNYFERMGIFSSHINTPREEFTLEDTYCATLAQNDFCNSSKMFAFNYYSGLNQICILTLRL